MFETIYIENSLQDHPRLKKILGQFRKSKTEYLDNYTEIFGAYRKPYLQKRGRLNLFIAEKKGQLVKEAPEAYGLSGEKHYYYIHAFNCIYECEYCYLQGYFDSPDIVIFLNHDDVLNDMQKIVHEARKTNVWFHAGEFSDSLALSHLTGEISAFYPFFREHKNAKLEFRTKSANTVELLKLEPLDNVFTSFSLSPESQTGKIEHKTASLKARFQAMKKLSDHGHKIAVHFDPVIYTSSYIEEYESLLKQMSEYIDPSIIEYYSLGVVRFTKDVFNQVLKHYPESSLLGAELVTSFDGKVRYPKPLRMSILKTLEKLLLKRSVDKDKIYLCME